MYIQADGVKMGSPLGPPLAKIFMGHLEYSVVSIACLHRLFTSDTWMVFMICFWYVDIKLENIIKSCLKNWINKMIYFTREVEGNNELSFLDNLIFIKKDNFQTSFIGKSLLCVNTWAIIVFVVNDKN